MNFRGSDFFEIFRVSDFSGIVRGPNVRKFFRGSEFFRKLNVFEITVKKCQKMSERYSESGIKEERINRVHRGYFQNLKSDKD